MPTVYAMACGGFRKWQAGVAQAEWGEEEQEEELLRLSGCQDVSMSGLAWSVGPPVHRAESQGQQRVVLCGDTQERAVRKLRQSGQTAPQNYTFGNVGRVGGPPSELRT